LNRVDYVQESHVHLRPIAIGSLDWSGVFLSSIGNLNEISQQFLFALFSFELELKLEQDKWRKINGGNEERRGTEGEGGFAINTILSM
jgi:hypothetical protein